MKTTEEFYQQLLAGFEERIGTEVSAGCDLAVRLYAVAAQLEALSAQTDWVQKQCFPQTAEGKYLDYHAEMRAVKRRAAAFAAGSIRFSVREAAEEDLPIPAGTLCISTRGVHFETTEAGILKAGALFADVPARAVAAGTAGNTPADTIRSLSVPPVGIVKCTNPAPFTGGEDKEDDDSLRGRILDSCRRLPNGANAAFYESTVLEHPAVVAAKAVGRARGIGTVDVYAAAAAGKPGEALLQELQRTLEEKREIAVDVRVLAPALHSVEVSVQLYPAADAARDAVHPAAEAALRGYFTGERLGKPVLLADLHALLHGVEGLANYRILSPAADVAVKGTELPVLGALTLETL